MKFNFISFFLIFCRALNTFVSPCTYTDKRMDDLQDKDCYSLLLDGVDLEEVMREDFRPPAIELLGNAMLEAVMEEINGVWY